MIAILNIEEVARLLKDAHGLEYKVVLSLACGTGFRILEIVSLKSAT